MPGLSMFPQYIKIIKIFIWLQIQFVHSEIYKAKSEHKNSVSFSKINDYLYLTLHVNTILIPF